MIKKMTMLALTVCTLCATEAQAQIKLGGKTLNAQKLVQAGADMIKAVTLSDADIAALSREAVEWMDSNNPVSPDTSAYSQRLKRLTENVKVDGLELNFKVYEVADVNAFACGDGSVRVFSSLMDLMDDRQLMGVIGHEIGHVVHADTKDAMKNAYMASAARNAAGSAGGTLAKLTDSQLGDLVQAFSNAQFSQKQESAADDFGFDFCVQNGLDPYSMGLGPRKTGRTVARLPVVGTAKNVLVASRQPETRRADASAGRGADPATATIGTSTPS